MKYLNCALLTLFSVFRRFYLHCFFFYYTHNSHYSSDEVNDDDDHNIIIIIIRLTDVKHQSSVPSTRIHYGQKACITFIRVNVYVK